MKSKINNIYNKIVCLKLCLLNNKQFMIYI
uniref:Uncharacterized protein n=1 Tax=viral metagenome TaxID=1070528 RepID=A0A6C0H8D3_9ZZZZ